jgi:hypothetical protein
MAPKVTVYDCKQNQTLPGTPIPNPKASTDATCKRAFNETNKVAQFYKQRDSYISGAGSEVRK